jgi:hypothetical protein
MSVQAMIEAHEVREALSLMTRPEAGSVATSSAPSAIPGSRTTPPDDAEASRAQVPRAKNTVAPVYPGYTSANSRAMDPPTSNSSGIAAARTASQMLPGFGKMLALPSQQACDVDAFVDDDDATSVVSSTDTTGDLYDDLEANGNSRPRTPSIRKVEPPLDPNTDPFTPRVGKTLSWRNINMTLVRCVLCVVW